MDFSTDKVPGMISGFFEQSPAVLLEWVQNYSEHLDSGTGGAETEHTQAGDIMIINNDGETAAAVPLDHALQMASWLGPAITTQHIRPRYCILDISNPVIYSFHYGTACTSSIHAMYSPEAIARDLVPVHRRIRTILDSTGYVHQDKLMRIQSYMTGICMKIAAANNIPASAGSATDAMASLNVMITEYPAKAGIYRLVEIDLQPFLGSFPGTGD